MTASQFTYDPMVSFNHLKKMNLKNACTAEDIYPVVSEISSLFRAKQYEVVNRFLQEADVDSLSDLAKVCLVRTTFAAKEKLSEWEPLLNTIAQTIHNPQEALKGLLKND